MVRTSTRPRHGSNFHLTGAIDLFPKSYNLVQKNLGVFLALFFLPLVVGLSNGVTTWDNERHWTNDALFFGNAVGNSSLPAYAWGGIGLAFLFAMAIAVVLRVMTHKAQLIASKNESVNFSELWQAVKQKGWQMFGLYLLVGVITVIGFFLLIIPGIIMLRRYFLAPYVLLDKKGIGIWDAMGKSADMSRRYSGSIYRIIGVMVVISLFGIVPLLGWIASFILAFFYNVAPAIRYQELNKVND